MLSRLALIALITGLTSVLFIASAPATVQQEVVPCIVDEPVLD